MLLWNAFLFDCLLLNNSNNKNCDFFTPQYKLCKVRKVWSGKKGVPHLSTFDARTIRYPDPIIKVNDTVKVDIATGKITDYIHFDSGKYLVLIELNHY